jgi:hypothetical protein
MGMTNTHIIWRTSLHTKYKCKQLFPSPMHGSVNPRTLYPQPTIHTRSPTISFVMGVSGDNYKHEATTQGAISTRLAQRRKAWLTYSAHTYPRSKSKSDTTCLSRLLPRSHSQSHFPCGLCFREDPVSQTSVRGPIWR